MIRPVLEYGDILFDNLPKSLSNQIEKIQRRAAIACTRSYKHTSYKSLLHELNWEPLTDRRRMHRLITYYKITHRMVPQYLQNHLPPPTNINYNLRHKPPLRPRFARLTRSSNSFFISTTNDWNGLPDSTRNCDSILAFKKIIRGPNLYFPYHRLCSGKREAWLSRIRMGLSALNEQRHSYNFIDSPICSSCDTDQVETPSHYFLHCDAYRVARTALYFSLAELHIDTTDNNKTLETILHGTHTNHIHHTRLLKCITQFMHDTQRFR